MPGRSSQRFLPRPDQPISTMSGPRLSSRDSCRRTPRKRSGMAFGGSAQNREQLVLTFSRAGRAVAMQRSSQSIASLAAALAKAQIELSNPEKSLIGSIEGKERSEERRVGKEGRSR